MVLEPACLPALLHAVNASNTASAAAEMVGNRHPIAVVPSPSLQRRKHSTLQAIF